MLHVDSSEAANMQITIAGYGSIGHYLEEVFARKHTIKKYDPPLGLGCPEDLVEADFVFICVPTPTLPEGTSDLDAVEEVVALAKPRHAIVCQSTLPVGTTDRLIAAHGRHVVYVPEYA